MGSAANDEDARENEKPQHAVDLGAYRIGRYPVTNLEYKAFVEAKGPPPPRHWEGGQFPDEMADHPVVYVSWEDATAYCAWLSEVSGNPYRLPTEAEWEKAARGTDGRIYPWGDEWDAKRCNTQEDGPGGTTPVGQYSTAGDSPVGCADMAGNVWEWTDSWYKAYPESEQQDDAYSQKFRGLRGGSWVDDQDFARCAFRVRLDPDGRDGDGGFRLVSPI
jgi:formylglycine-generating enzyme required for sulfatase activity